MKLARAPGFLAYATLLMWFLLTVLAPMRAGAEEPASPAATAVKLIDLLPDIEMALAENGAAEDAEIALAQPEATLLVAQGAKPAFDSVSFNPGSGRFLIRARGVTETISIAGFARPRVSLPVLARPVARGDVIAETDIAWIETTDARPAGVVLKAGDLVGMETRRALPAGTPIRTHDVSAPLLVQKGKLVTIAFETAGLRLTHAGVALGDGANGELVDVRNVKSERVVKAVVAGPNLVSAISARRAPTTAELY